MRGWAIRECGSAWASTRARWEEIGSLGRLDDTAMGDVVNAASRIESENKAQGTEVLLSAAICELQLPEEHASLGIEETPREEKVKGKEEKLLLYAVGVP